MGVVRFLDLSRQIAALRQEIDRATHSVLDSARFTGGEHVECFEHAFAEWCGARHAVGVASGTDALALALRALGVGDGDEVVTGANTCIPTVAAIEQTGATPVLADVDSDTWTVDPASVDAACTPRTKAVVPVHLYGQCADMRTISGVARDRGLVVVEDAAQAHGASYGGYRAGTLGDAAAFSFYPTKNLGALGDAGAVVTNCEETARKVRMLANYGESERYLSVVPGGTNSRLDNLQAAVLREKLVQIDRWTQRRRELAAHYRESLAECSVHLPLEAPLREHVWHLFVVLVPDRATFRARLAQAGIETLVHYPRAVHKHPAYRHLGTDRLTVSERLSEQVVSLPLYPELSDQEADRVIQAVLEAAG